MSQKFQFQNFKIITKELKCTKFIYNVSCLDQTKPKRKYRLQVIAVTFPVDATSLAILVLKEPSSLPSL